MVQLEGKYQHEKSTNYDEFLKSIGVPLVPRKVMVNSNPSVEVTKTKTQEEGEGEGEGEVWVIKMSTMLRDIVYRFTPGKPMHTDSMGGSAKNVFTIEGNTIKQQQQSPNFSLEVLREFTDEGINMTMKHNESGTVCQRYFKRTK